jgi:uncharacterized protein
MNGTSLLSLLKPEAYPDPTTEVGLFQTHVSFLFVTDRFVYKVKKPVDLGFLDFTTLERRQFYCQEELRLNRRLAPEIYLDVVPVRDSSSGVTLCGNGEIIDYAVKMVRLPQELMMNRLLAEGMVTVAQIRAVADIIARFHLTAATGEEIADHGKLAAIRANWQENFRIVAPFVGQTISSPDFCFIRHWVEEFLDHNEHLFQARLDRGYIREGDGDLHSGNICLTDPPIIFDCIEFNVRFRCLDTAADIAFLLMDLEYFGAASLRRQFLEQYVLVTGDDGMRELLPFYKIYRAFIRGEVESIKGAQPELSTMEREETQESARRHFSLARGMIIREKLSRTLFITCGLSGSGKSSVALELSRQLDLEYYSSDLVRKQLAGLPATRRCADDDHDAIYSQAFTRTTYDRLRDLAKTGLSDGRSVIVDATFRDQRERALFQQLASTVGSRFIILYIRSPETVILERLSIREQLQDVISDAGVSVYFRQKKEFVPPETAEGVVMVVDTAETLLHTIDALMISLGVLPCGHD